jgi:hypothetical protein
MLGPLSLNTTLLIAHLHPDQAHTTPHHTAQSAQPIDRQTDRPDWRLRQAGRYRLPGPVKESPISQGRGCVVPYVSLSTPQSIMSICSWKASAHSAGMPRRRRVTLSQAPPHKAKGRSVRSGQVSSQHTSSHHHPPLARLAAPPSPLPLPPSAPGSGQGGGHSLDVLADVLVGQAEGLLHLALLRELREALKQHHDQHQHQSASASHSHAP